MDPDTSPNLDPYAMSHQTLRNFAIALLGLTLVTGCFSDHASDVRSAWNKKIVRAHRRWDRYFNGLDWDDPTHEWSDESYARGPMIGR